MAIYASHRPRLVRAARPEHLIAFGMAGKAGCIPFFDWRGRIFGEADWNRVLTPTRVNVGLARSVTCLAAKLLGGSLGMRHGVPHDRMNEALLLVGMAGDAHLAAYVVGRASVRGCIASLSGRSRGCSLRPGREG